MASDNTTGHRAGEDAVFECSMCGDCCRGFGGTYVSEEDITAISEYIGVLRDRFVRAYCSLSGGKPVLAQGDNGRCIFWDKVCTIHPVKPRMCRQWPFIPAILVDVLNWRIMAASCKGMRTDLSDAEIAACVKSKLGI